MVALVILLHSACIRKSVFRSPYTNLQNSYHVMPLLSDSNRSANYLSLASSHGFSNDDWTDGLVMAQIKYHHAVNLGNFQGFAGAHAHAGYYRISQTSYFDNYYNEPWQDSTYPGPTGKQFTGSVGINAGMVYTLAFGKRVEWRILGVEFSAGREFGDYLQVRKEIPDSVVTYIDKRNTPVTLGGFSELLFKPSNPKFRFGYQLAIGSGIHKMNNAFRNREQLITTYVNNTFHFTVNRYTGYVQARIGNYFGAAQLGFTYRL